jgi:hypothetical protein
VEGRVARSKKHRNTASARDKLSADRKTDLQICGAGRKSRKRLTLFVGRNPKGKYQLNNYSKKTKRAAKKEQRARLSLDNPQPVSGRQGLLFRNPLCPGVSGCNDRTI